MSASICNSVWWFLLHFLHNGDLWHLLAMCLGFNNSYTGQPSWPCPIVPLMTCLGTYCNLLVDGFLLFRTPHTLSLMSPRRTCAWSSTASARMLLTQIAKLACRGVLTIRNTGHCLKVTAVLYPLQPRHFVHLQFHCDGEEHFQIEMIRQLNFPYMLLTGVI